MTVFGGTGEEVPRFVWLRTPGMGPEDLAATGQGSFDRTREIEEEGPGSPQRVIARALDREDMELPA